MVRSMPFGSVRRTATRPPSVLATPATLPLGPRARRHGAFGAVWQCKAHCHSAPERAGHAGHTATRPSSMPSWCVRCRLAVCAMPAAPLRVLVAPPGVPWDSLQAVDGISAGKYSSASCRSSSSQTRMILDYGWPVRLDQAPGQANETYWSAPTLVSPRRSRASATAARASAAVARASAAWALSSRTSISSKDSPMTGACAWLSSVRADGQVSDGPRSPKRPKLALGVILNASHAAPFAKTTLPLSLPGPIHSRRVRRKPVRS